MKDVDALVQKLRMRLLVLAADVLNTKAEQLEILLICIPQDLLELSNLTDAALPRDYGPDRVLNRRLLCLKVLDLLDHNRSILLWLQPIDAIEEHGPVIVRN